MSFTQRTLGQLVTVCCDRCGHSKPFPRGDKGIRRWVLTHLCPEPDDGPVAA